MGGQKKERQPIEALYSTAMSMLLSARILEHFEMWDAQESRKRWVIEMREKKGRIPKSLSEFADVVFNGYSNPVEMIFLEVHTNR